MSETDPVGSADSRPLAVASYRHTAILVAVFLALAAAGAVFQKAPAPETAAGAGHASVIPLYLSLLAAEWGLVLFVWKRGLVKTGTRLRDLIGGRYRRWPDVARDVALASVVWILWMGIQRGFDLWGGADHSRSVDAYLPHGPLEVALWIALSASAGFCEEAVFRGYFQRQFSALTRSRWAGLVLQALLFGISHGYQGIGAMARIALFGLLYGGLALWRKSLRPGMVAHAWSDVYSGWLGMIH
jgi:membrane protease YdiL (CAAX protease family)